VADPKKPVDLTRLGVAGTEPRPKYAEIASASEEQWKPGKKVWLNRHPPVAMSADLSRVLALPRRPQLDLESERARALADMMTDRWTRGPRACRCADIDPKIRAGKKKCPTRFKEVQAWLLYELGIVGGALAHVPTGAGKSYVDVAAPLALAQLGIRHSLILVPPNLLEQLERDYLVFSEHFRVPSAYFHGLERRYDVAGAPMLHVLPYSRLSLPTSSDWVRNLRPEAILSDECDRLRDPQGAGSSRVVRYFQEFGDTRFAGWTGTLTEQSICDYAHLALLALRDQSPLPHDPAVVAEWARALDESENPAPPGELGRLCGEDLDPEDTEQVREAYRRRLAETMGVVVSSTASVDVEVIIEPRSAPPLPEIVDRALRMVRDDWVRPDTLAGADHDEELVDAMQVAKCARELASGVFYRWRFPRINGVAQKRETIDEWFDARKDWNRELRRKLSAREEWLDSPLLCEHAAQRHYDQRPKRDDRPEWDSSSWLRWSAIKGRVVHETEAVRVSDYLALDAARWAHQYLGVVWYDLVEFGQWVAELSGLPLHGGGPKAGARIDREVGDHSIVASISSHGRGRDGLQALFSNQLVAQVPGSATRWQQLIARLARQGQEAAEVRVFHYDHTPEIRAAFEQALRRARYVRGTVGESQFLLGGNK
jgi:hypothetical protein